MHPTAPTTDAVLDQLRAVHRTRTELDTRRRHLIHVALAAGHTWAEIADALDDTELGAILDHLATTAAEAEHGGGR